MRLSSSVILTSLIVACALVALLFLIASGRGLRRRRFGACAFHGVSSLAFFLAAAVVALVGLDLLTYDRLTHEQSAVRASFAQAGEQQFNATLTYPSGEVRGYVLRGDEWQIDARVLKWRGVANLVGFDTAYRLERIGGRYGDIERDRTAPRTVYALHPPGRLDAWALLRAWRDYLPWADALYGSATYVPMADRAAYEITVSQSGLVARPLNSSARLAVGGWQ